MDFLETRVPPPGVTLAVAASMWGAARLAPSLTVQIPYLGALGAAIGMGGVLLELVAVVTFRRVCTSVNPFNPAAATHLVVVGVYRFTRNPIYLGDFLILIGWAIFLGIPVGLAFALLFVAYIDRFQIQPEERILADKFGRPYDDYRARVRRWI